MGERVLCHPDAESPSQQSGLSVLSDALGPHISFDALWFSFNEVRKVPESTLACKSRTVLEQSASVLKTAEIFDSDCPAELAQDTGEDSSIVTKVRLGKGLGTMVIDYSDSAGALFRRHFQVIHKDPVRLECWREAPGARLDDVGGRLRFALRWVIPRVLVRRDAPSPSGSGRSVVSDPLDEVLDYDALWSGINSFYRQPFRSHLGTGESKHTILSETESSLMEVLDGKKVAAEGFGDGSGQDVTVISFSRFFRLNNEVSSEVRDLAGNLLETRTMVVHTDPLRLEVWAEARERRSGEKLAGAVRGLIRAAFAHAGIGYKGDLVTVTHDVPSLSTPGRKSVISEPLDSHMDFEHLWSGTIQWARDVRNKEACKSSKLTDISSTNFMIAEVLDAEKISVQEQGGSKGEDVQITTTFTFDKDAGLVRREFRGPLGRVFDVHLIVIHKDPLIIEYWAEAPKQRRHGAMIRDLVQTFLNYVIMGARPDVEFIHVGEEASLAGGGGTSWISGPLDSHTTYGDLWEGLIRLFTNPINLGTMKRVDKDIVSENEFTVTEVCGAETLEEGLVGEDVVHFRKYWMDRASGEILAEHFTDGRLIRRDFIILHKDPLRAEAWSEEPGKRYSGEELRRFVQFHLDEALKWVAPT